jgi:phenylacetate-CoA ligase
MRRLDRINGRTDDMLIIRGVNVFPSQIEELILKQRRFAPVYQLEVTRTGHVDALAVNVEWPVGENTASGAREVAARDLARRIKSSVGVTVEVRVVDAGALERSAGKARRVIDHRHS